MKIEETKLKGCFILQPNVYQDKRGFFFESFNEKLFFEKIGSSISFIQDNQSFSNYGVLRGLHLQKGKNAQAKLVRVLSGEVLDVAVDLRTNSSTYGQHIAIKLSASNKTQLFIPRGFAHGFIVLSKTADFFYKVDNYYAPKSEGGLLFNDPKLNIDWLIDKKDIIVAKKDYEHPLLENFNPE